MTRMTRSAFIPSAVVQSQSAAADRRMPAMFRKLLVAISRPFSWSPLRCCSKALSGTAKRPPKNPTKIKLTAASVNDCDERESRMANRLIPIDAQPLQAEPDLPPRIEIDRAFRRRRRDVRNPKAERAAEHRDRHDDDAD